MNSPDSFEKMAMMITSLDREEIKVRLLNFEGRFKLDFTEDYLESLSIDRLRHILLAAMTTNAK
jgi:hypothetical protein